MISKTQIENLAAFRYAMRRFLRFSENAARKAGLSPQQYQLLLTIKGMPGREWAYVTEIAERLQISHHGAVALITRAQKQHLVHRTPGQEDRRTVQVTLADKGEELLGRLSALHQQELGQLSNQLREQLEAITTDL